MINQYTLFEGNNVNLHNKNLFWHAYSGDQQALIFQPIPYNCLSYREHFSDMHKSSHFYLYIALYNTHYLKASVLKW